MSVLCQEIADGGVGLNLSPCLSRPGHREVYNGLQRSLCVPPAFVGLQHFSIRRWRRCRLWVACMQR